MSQRTGTSRRPRCTAAIRELREALRALPHEARPRPAVVILQSLSARFRTLGRSLAWIAAYDEEGQLRDVALLLLMSAADAPVTLPRRLFAQAAELTERALFDARLSDERKIVLLPILTHGGREVDPQALASCFDDLQGALARATAHATADLADTAEHVEAGLQVMGLVDERGQSARGLERVRDALGMAAATAEGNPRLGCTTLATIAAVGLELGAEPTGELCAALELAAQFDPPRALALLTELGTWPGTGEVGARARALSMRLRAGGVEPQPLATPAFSHGLVSAVDGSGAQALLLLYRHDGDLDALAFVLKDGVGLKDVWCAAGQGDEIERQYRETGLSLAPCDEACARELIADALATNEAAGHPVPGRWLLYRAHLGPAPLAPARRAPSLEAYRLATIPRGPRLAEGSDALLDSLAFDGLGFDSPAAYAFVRERGGRPDEALVGEFLQAVEPHERARVTRRLAINLELEARAGRGEQPLNRLAARTWVALSEGLVPWHEVPYARALAEHALPAIAENLSLGFRTQDEVNQAALNMDFEGALDELAGLIELV